MRVDVGGEHFTLSSAPLFPSGESKLPAAFRRVRRAKKYWPIRRSSYREGRVRAMDAIKRAVNSFIKVRPAFGAGCYLYFLWRY